jgi:hypothetical protein
MPISTNPNATAPYWLASDAEVPLAQRPVLLVRFLTTAQLQQHEAILQQAVAESDDRRCAELLIQAVRLGVVGWRNYRLPFSDQAFFDLLTDRERWEAAWNYPAAVRLTPVDLGNSALPATSAGPADAADRPAEPVPAAPAPAASDPTRR